MTARELDAWQVFADELTERGDRLGPYLAYELSLGDAPTKEQLQVFHKKALRICRVPRGFSATWMLGQVRSLTITRDRTKPVPWVSGDDLLSLRDLLPAPHLQQLECLVLQAGAHSVRRRWEAAMARLSRTCTTFVLHTRTIDADQAKVLLEGIPASVETVRLVPHHGTDVAGFVSDRLAWLDLRGVPLSQELARSLLRALRSTSRVKLRLGTVSRRSLMDSMGERATMGGIDDAALVEDAPEGVVALLERTSLADLQERHGIVTARAQLTRGLEESFRLGKTSFGLGDSDAWTGDAVISRRAGQWWVRATGEPGFALNGALLTAERTPLKDGDRLELGRRSFRFVSTCDQ